MPFSLHQASVPVLIRGLQVLSALIAKGAAHAAEAGTDPAALVGARLAPDMLPFSGQVQRASDTAKLSAARLTGTAAPSFADEETSFEELQERVRKTIAYLQGVPEADFEGGEAREITLGSGDSARRFKGDDYLLSFALPNFFFHVTTAYDILRHNGVRIGKRDYLYLPVG
jgi:hypothetical protein